EASRPPIESEHQFHSKLNLAGTRDSAGDLARRGTDAFAGKDKKIRTTEVCPVCMLKASDRNSTFALSVIGIVLKTETSISASPGPSGTPRPTFPQVPNAGRLKAFGSNHWSTRAIFTGP